MEDDSDFTLMMMKSLESNLKKKKRMPRSEAGGGCMYAWIYSRGDSHPCCAVLRDFLQLGFLGGAVCPYGLASV